MSKMSRVLKELLLGVLICGICFQIVLLLPPGDKILRAAGLWIGVLFSMGKAIHIERSLQNAWSRSEKQAAGYLRLMCGLRTAASLLLIAAVWYWEIGNIASLFLGMMALKGGAFLQMPIDQLLNKYESGRRTL